MVAKLDILNDALVLLGKKTVEGPSDAGAVELNAIYDAQRDAVIRLHTWNFADTRITVTADAGVTPAYGYNNQFTLPPEPYCLRVLQVADDWAAQFVVVRKRKIWTDEGSPLSVRYLGREEDESMFDSLFAQVFGLRLAWRASFKMVDSRTLRKDLREEYLKELMDARSADGAEGWPGEIEASEFLDARE